MPTQDIESIRKISRKKNFTIFFFLSLFWNLFRSFWNLISSHFYFLLELNVEKKDDWLKTICVKLFNTYSTASAYVPSVYSEFFRVLENVLSIARYPSHLLTEKQKEVKEKLFNVKRVKRIFFGAFLKN